MLPPSGGTTHSYGVLLYETCDGLGQVWAIFTSHEFCLSTCPFELKYFIKLACADPELVYVLRHASHQGKGHAFALMSLKQTLINQINPVGSCSHLTSGKKSIMVHLV